MYVISNVGAFGPDVVKIGMTRRLEPMDRVRELGDASVPFRFDCHALFFSNDAVSLENALHHRFAEQRVNLVNLRREFFYATPAQVRQAVAELGNDHLLEFTEDPEALEWRASNPARRAGASVADAAADPATNGSLQGTAEPTLVGAGVSHTGGLSDPGLDGDLSDDGDA